MSVIKEYQKLFKTFHINYLKICFFQKKSAADRVNIYMSLSSLIIPFIDLQLSEALQCLLQLMTDDLEVYTKPMVHDTPSIYGSNLIQSSQSSADNIYERSKYRRIDSREFGNTVDDFRCRSFLLIELFVFFLPNREWEINSFKLSLFCYHEWFSPVMTFIIEGFIAHIRQTMERALDDDNVDI